MENKDKYISRHINKLMLDPNNYRFIDNKDYKPVPESEISDKRIQDRTYNFLIGKNEDQISDLIISFKSNGILKLDPIQVKELPDGNLLVVEGNRRTAALKYLYDQFQKSNDVGRLQEKDFKSIELVLIADESPVQHLITMGLHHISGKRKWSPVNQAQLVSDLRFKHGMTEEDVCNSLAITKHNLRRNIRVLALIERYKASDYGDQFQTNMYSVFEEIIKNVRVKSWLQWNDHEMKPDNADNEERLFSWISKETKIEYLDDGSEQEFTNEPIITKSHEIRELSKFIEDEAAIAEMEESRSITAGFILSDAVGEARLKNAIENITKEVNDVFKFSEYIGDIEIDRIEKVKTKIEKLISNESSSVEVTKRQASIYFNHVTTHFTEIEVLKYRKLDSISINNLGKVNIFAGGNNTGKTSILELIFLFTRLNTIQSLIELEKFRGRFYQNFSTKWFDKIFVEDIIISGEFNGRSCGLKISKYESQESFDKSHYLNSVLSESNVSNDSFSSTMHLFSNTDPQLFYDKSQFLCEATFTSPYRFNDDLLKKAHAKSIQDKYFDRILNFIKDKMDDSIEKIEMVNIDGENRFMVSSAKIEHAVDITKYGEGLQRVFEIALLMGYSSNGVICIDELDSALHKSLLIDFTSFIQQLADDFNVQVFLTTHSKECIDAFVENDYPDDELTAFSLTEENGKTICKFIEGNKLKRLVGSMNLDIR